MKKINWMLALLCTKLITLLALAFCLQSEGHADCLDLQTAWSRVLFFSPALAGAFEEVEIKVAEMEQASLLPNPIAGVDAENLGVKDKCDEAEPPQTTFVLTQLVELGGKRSARVAFAASQTEIACLETQIARQDLFQEFKTHFINVSAEQEKFKIAQERLLLAEKKLETLCLYKNAGKVTPIQQKKAELAFKSAQVELREAASHLAQAKKQLSSLWGSACIDFDSVYFDLWETSPPPDPCSLSEAIDNSIDLILAEQMICSGSQMLRMERANQIPDVAVSVGYRIYNDSNQHGWVVGFQMPLPLFNRNQGNVRRACNEISQAEFEREEVERSLSERAFTVYEKLLAAFEESEIIKAGVLPDANEALNLTEEGFQKGKLDYLELLESQETFLEIEEQWVDVLAEYHLNKTELDRLCGAWDL